MDRVIARKLVDQVMLGLTFGEKGRLKGVDVFETLTGARIKIVVHLRSRGSKEIGDPPPHSFTAEELETTHHVIDDCRHPL